MWIIWSKLTLLSEYFPPHPSLSFIPMVFDLHLCGPPPVSDPESCLAPSPLSIHDLPSSPTSQFLSRPCLCPHSSEALMLYLPLAPAARRQTSSVSMHKTLVLSIPLTLSLCLCVFVLSLSLFQGLSYWKACRRSWLQSLFLSHLGDAEEWASP